MNAEALCGKVLGTCTLQKIIGRGGMGAVYLAQQSRPKRQVAVKVLLPLAALQPNQHKAFLERFRRETDAAAALQHPNIMPVHEYGEREGHAYLVMPYVSGGTLRDELDVEGRLPLTRVVIYLEQMAAALDSAHAQGVIHRDIKPANIMMTPEKRLLLTDFGLVKIITDRSEQQNPLSEAGMPMGTPDYMAPEQVVGREIDSRADLYSLGVLVYHMVTGTVPFTGSSPMKVAMHHMHTPPPPPRVQRPDLPINAEKVILRALAKRPADRYANAREMANAFRKALEDAGVQVENTPSGQNEERQPGARPRGLFDPVWRNHLTAPSTEPKLKAQPKQQPNNRASKGIVAKTSMTMHSLTDILTQNNIPVVKAEKSHSSPTALADEDSLLPPPETRPPVEQDTGDHTPLPAITGEEEPNIDAPLTTVQHTPLPPVREMNNQQGPANFSNNPWNMPPQGEQPKPGHKSLLGPRFRNPSAQQPGTNNWQQENSPAAPQFPAGPVVPTFNSPAQDNQVPQADFGTPYNASQNAFPSSTQNEQQGAHWSYTNDQANDATHQMQPMHASGQWQQSGNITRQLGSPTGQLGAPTGHLGEYSGNTGMLKLNHAVKVVRVPVAGQPGQYKTGILPVQPRTGMLPPPNSPVQDNSLNGKMKKNGKILFILLAILVILSGSSIFLLTRPSDTGKQATTNTSKNNNTASNQKANATATATAGVEATATAEVSNRLYSYPLDTNIGVLPVGDDNVSNKFYKEGSYHILTKGKYVGYVLLGQIKPPSKYSYSLTLKSIKGDDESEYNFSGLMLRYTTVGSGDKAKAKFYFFRIVYQKDNLRYMFHKYDGTNEDNPWGDPLFEKKVGKEFKGIKEKNILKVAIDGDKFTFFANGVKIGEKKDSSYKEGSLGLGVNNENTETSFNDLTITQN